MEYFYPRNPLSIYGSNSGKLSPDIYVKDYFSQDGPDIWYPVDTIPDILVVDIKKAKLIPQGLLTKTIFAIYFKM